MADNPMDYYRIWIGDVRCIIECEIPARGSTFSFSVSEFPERRRDSSLLVQRHYLKNGKWHVTNRIRRKDKVAIANIVNKAHTFIHRLILMNGKAEHLPVNANYESGTAWDVP